MIVTRSSEWDTLKIKKELLLHRGLHGLLNFVGEPVEMFIQSVEQFAFGRIRRQVAN